MGKIFSFCNQKGGVGKTTSVVNVAACLAKNGYKVLVIDMDAQANSTSGLGEEKPSFEFTTYQLLVENIEIDPIVKQTAFENLSLIPASADLSGAELELINRENREFVLKSRLEKISLKYDFIFIDCPPSLGLITVNCLVSSNYVIIPLQCEYYALEGLSQLFTTYQLIRKNLNPELEIGGVLLTMADFRTNLTQQVIEEVKGFFKEKVFETIIPRSVKLSEAPSFGKPAVFYDPMNKGSKSYQAVTEEFVARFSEKKEKSGQEVSEPNPETETKTQEVAS